MVKDIESKMNSAQSTTAPKGLFYDPGRRYPLVTSPDGYDALSDLTEEDKRVGVEMLKISSPDKDGLVQTPEHHAVQSRNPGMMYQSDPKLFEKAINCDLSKLVIGLADKEIALWPTANGVRTDDPDIRHRYQLAWLIIAKVAHENQDEWTLRLVATLPALLLSKQQLALLGQPQSVVWDEEQRLMLEFAEGVMRQTVSDECFARAEAAWGRKQTLRYAAWTAHYVGFLMFNYLNVSDAERTGQW